jgi:hypothetical protein
MNRLVKPSWVTFGDVIVTGAVPLSLSVGCATTFVPARVLLSGNTVTPKLGVEATVKATAEVLVETLNMSRSPFPPSVRHPLAT